MGLSAIGGNGGTRSRLPQQIQKLRSDSITSSEDEEAKLRGNRFNFLVFKSQFNFSPGQSSRTESSNQLDSVEPEPDVWQLAASGDEYEDGDHCYDSAEEESSDGIPHPETSIFVKRGQQFVELKPSQVGVEVLQRMGNAATNSLSRKKHI